MNNLEEQYRIWIAKNPTVMPAYRRFARELLNRGKKFSIALLTERIRWEAHMTWQTDHDFKLNNNFRAYVARDLIQEMPGLADMLVLRKVRKEEPSLF